MKFFHIFVIITVCTFTVHQAVAVPVQEWNEENKSALEQGKIPQDILDGDDCCPKQYCYSVCPPELCCW